MFGVDTDDAAGYTLANHAVQIFPVIIAVLISAVLTGMRIKKILKISHLPYWKEDNHKNWRGERS